MLISYHNNHDKIWYPLSTIRHLQTPNTLKKRKSQDKIRTFLSELFNFISPVKSFNTSQRPINQFLLSKQLFFQQIKIYLNSIGDQLQSLPADKITLTKPNSAILSFLNHSLQINHQNGLFILLKEEIDSLHLSINQALPQTFRPFRISYRQFLFDFKKHLHTQHYAVAQLIIHKTYDLLSQQALDPHLHLIINKNDYD